MLEDGEEAWAYNFFPKFLLGFLKYLKMVLTSLGGFARIGGEKLKIKAGLAITLSFLKILAPIDGGLNCILIFHLKEKLSLSTIISSYPAS